MRSVRNRCLHQRSDVWIIYMLVSGMASAARVPRPEAFTPKESPAAGAIRAQLCSVPL